MVDDVSDSDMDLISPVLYNTQYRVLPVTYKYTNTPTNTDIISVIEYNYRIYNYRIYNYRIYNYRI